MTAEIKKQIKNARPSLRKISPVSFWFIALMGVFNLILGSALFLTIDEGKLATSLIIVNDLFTFKFWGIVFILLGIYKLYSLKENNWKLARYSLLFGVGIKSAWMVALVIRIMDGGTIFLSLCWVTIALTQMICYIFFIPPQEMTDRAGNKLEAE